jgi:hypothetical protein
MTLGIRIRRLLGKKKTKKMQLISYEMLTGRKIGSFGERYSELTSGSSQQSQSLNGKWSIQVPIGSTEEAEVKTGPWTIYIAGPMTGRENFNFEAFNEAEDRWTIAGWQVLNPAKTDNGSQHRPREFYLRKDLHMLAEADAIALLPEWELSAGATMEMAIAKELGLETYDAVTMKPFDETCVQEAQRIVYSNRRADYGHPATDFKRTAALWSIILDSQVDSRDVGLCMIALKMSRQLNKPKRDNLVDIAGYAETINMIDEYDKKVYD